jgi:hypothetical protein
MIQATIKSLKNENPMKTNNKLKSSNANEPDNADNALARPMLSLDVSKSILNKYGITYTDEEIVIIREFMYRLAEITASWYQRLKESNSELITLPPNNYDETKSISIRSSVYRRAG